MIRPTIYAPYYQHYIDLVKDDPIKSLDDQFGEVKDLINQIVGNLDFRYADGKWTFKEVIIHIIDTEFIFLYRLLRIVRGDQSPLQGFNQNTFIDGQDFSRLTSEDLQDLWLATRTHTQVLVKTLKETDFENIGTASEAQVSAGSLLYMIVGHAQHHVNIVKERYM